MSHYLNKRRRLLEVRRRRDAFGRHQLQLWTRPYHCKDRRRDHHPVR